MERMAGLVIRRAGRGGSPSMRWSAPSAPDSTGLFYQFGTSPMNIADAAAAWRQAAPNSCRVPTVRSNRRMNHWNRRQQAASGNRAATDFIHPRTFQRFVSNWIARRTGAGVARSVMVVAIQAVDGDPSLRRQTGPDLGF